MTTRAKDHLRGRSPNQIAAEHRMVAFLWLLNFGYSTGALLQMLLGQAASGWAARAALVGWLHWIQPDDGRSARLYTLSRRALELVESQATCPAEYIELDVRRINQALVRHNLMVQRATLVALQAGVVTRVEAEREIAGFDRQGQKRPDAVWHLPSGQRIGVELELSAKWSRQLDQFVLNVITAMAPAAEGAPRLDGFAILSTSDALLARYAEAFKPNARLPIWQHRDKFKWQVVEQRHVPAWVAPKVEFRKVEG